MAKDDVLENPEAAGAEQPATASQLFPLAYDMLRRVARNRMAGEAQNHSLQATALVHEAYLRLSNSDKPQQYHSVSHFYGAVTEIMRRILVEHARQKKRLKRGGGMVRVEVDPGLLPESAGDDDPVLALDEALADLTAKNSAWAELVKLRYFIGLTIPDAARVLGVSPRTADAWWAAARSWLRQKLLFDLDGVLS